jgi:uncharacterized protein YgbK (DUF1537 family)
MDGITVLVGTDDQVDVMKLENDIDALLDGSDIQIRYRLFDASSERDLSRVLKAEEAGTLVLGGRELLDKLPPLDTFLREIEMPLLILGDASVPARS